MKYWRRRSLLAFLAACDANGTVGAIELKDVLLAATNDDVVAALAAFYGLPGMLLIEYQ